jgi:hypothetical protein
VGLRDAHHIAIHTYFVHAVMHAVVVDEVDQLVPSTRGLEATRVRRTHREGERKHGDDRDGGGDTAETHVGPKLQMHLYGFPGSS